MEFPLLLGGAADDVVQRHRKVPNRVAEKI